MTPHEQLREEVAKAIYLKRNGHGCTPWSIRNKAHKAPYLEDATDALAVVRAALMEPTPEMERSYDWGNTFAGITGQHINVSVFRAMITASPLTPEGGR